MNPANQIKQKASKLQKSYWEYLSSKGFVHDIVHSELQELDTYNKKCLERKNNKGE